MISRGHIIFTGADELGAVEVVEAESVDGRTMVRIGTGSGAFGFVTAADARRASASWSAAARLIDEAEAEREMVAAEREHHDDEVLL